MTVPRTTIRDTFAIRAAILWGNGFFWTVLTYWVLP